MLTVQYLDELLRGLKLNQPDQIKLVAALMKIVPQCVIKGIITHHSLTKDGQVVDWQGIRVYHMSYRIDYAIVSREEFYRRKDADEEKKHVYETPWSDIGYHFGVEIVNGTYEVLVGRAMTKPGGHTLGYNRDYLGVCFIGNYDPAPPPAAMIDVAASRLYAPLLKVFNLTTTDIHGHREYAVKSCPGKLFDLDKLKEQTAIYLNQ